MAAIQLYNHTVSKLMNGEFPSTSPYKCMLLSDSATFDPEHETIDEVSNSRSYEVFGNGWAEGGEALLGVVIWVYDTDGAIFDADDIEVLISGGNLGPYNSFVIYKDDEDGGLVLGYYQFAAPTTTATGYGISILWPTTGIIKGSVI